jgi:hypothetical protein
LGAVAPKEEEEEEEEESDIRKLLTYGRSHSVGRTSSCTLVHGPKPHPEENLSLKLCPKAVFLNLCETAAR